MCLIVVKPKGANLPQAYHLREGEKNNKDGIGVAYWKQNTNEVHIKKNFVDITEFLEWMPANITIEDALIIHFRFATSGLKDEGNRHPFPITKNKELLREVELVCQQAVAHNGVMTSYSGHAKYSDTQKFVIDILADEKIKNNLDSEAVRKLIASFLDGDRLAVLDSNGSLYILGEWVKESDIYYSNSQYKTYVTAYGGVYGNDNYGYTNDYYSDYWQVKNNQPKQIEQKVDLISKKTSLKIGEIIGNGFHDNCDGCGHHKHVHLVELENATGQYSLCKSCRKGLRKGEFGLDDDGLSQKEKEKVMVKCYSCLEWVDELNTVMYEGNRYCDICIEKIPELYKGYCSS